MLGGQEVGQLKCSVSGLCLFSIIVCLLHIPTSGELLLILACANTDALIQFSCIYIL